MMKNDKRILTCVPFWDSSIYDNHVEKIKRHLEKGDRF